mgnify:CR=1 FL=1
MLRAIAGFLLRVFGWRTVYQAPPGPKSVIVVYPHTSNWDFPVGMLFRFYYAMPIRWAGKHTMFRWPLRGFFLRLGGVPINRSNPVGLIDQLADEFARSESLHLCIAPEGTRSYTDHWKSGFYRLAMKAGVPVGLGFIDFGRKEAGVERWITLSGDVDADLGVIRAYYAGKQGYAPEKASDIRFRTPAG